MIQSGRSSRVDAQPETQWRARLYCVSRICGSGGNPTSTFYIRSSDKGMYARGVLGLFESLQKAAFVFEHTFWREVIESLSSPVPSEHTRNKVRNDLMIDGTSVTERSAFARKPSVSSKKLAPLETSSGETISSTRPCRFKILNSSTWPNLFRRSVERLSLHPGLPLPSRRALRAKRAVLSEPFSTINREKIREICRARRARLSASL